MAVTDEQAIKLFDDIKDVCIDVIKDAHEFIKTHDLEKYTYYTDKYPGLATDFFYEDKYFKEADRQKIPFLKYRIPKYEMKQYPKDKKYYSLIFETYRTENINIKDYEKIEKINDWINSETDILKLFTDEDKISEYTIRGVVTDIVERYLYMTNATENIPDDIDKIINPYVARRLLFYLEDTLYFDICIPICLATFDKEIKLDDNVEIVKISEEIQKARQVKCRYEVATEDWVAACATHMILQIVNAIEYKPDNWQPWYNKKAYERVGYLGADTSDIDYESVSFIKWKNMIQRCYNKKVHELKPYYMDKNVCIEWQNYQNFKIWFDAHYIPGTKVDLDKDLLCKGMVISL